MKLDPTPLRFLCADSSRVLAAVEQGSRNHHIVPSALIASLSALRAGGVHKALAELAQRRLIARQPNAKYDGYTLTYAGYDTLALRTFQKRASVQSVGNQIGVGKEADVYLVAAPDGSQRVLKIHRLGRISFRAVKSKRDYLLKRKSPSWIYLSRLAAQKEFAFMNVLHKHGFPVPVPIDHVRHCLVMSLVDAFPLRQIHDIKHPGKLYSLLMDLIVRLARVGLIHGDFNEFNLLIDTSDPENVVPVLIDFPQMVSVEHENAEFYFNRDVKCIRSFFLKRFRYESKLYPKFTTVVRQGKREINLDVEVEASGWGKGESRKLEEYMEMMDDTDDDTDEAEYQAEDDQEFKGDDDEASFNSPDDASTHSSRSGVSQLDNKVDVKPAKSQDPTSPSGSDCDSLDEDDPHDLLPSEQPKVPATQEGQTLEEENQKKPSVAFTPDQLATIVADRLAKTRLTDQRRHHSKKSVKSLGRPKGSKQKADKKWLTRIEF